MKIIVTCGPGFEPIDEVRRITNFSTGELGVLLANRLARAGHEVTCLRGVHATHPEPLNGPRHIPFGTNDDLLRELESLAKPGDIGAVFHVAALSDYKVKEALDKKGERLTSPKITSRGGSITLKLEPATKVIARLRGLFPKARIVGWKYELAGTRDEALARAWQQLHDNHNDACVLNGRAYGDGFALCAPPDHITPLATKSELGEFLTGWLTRGAA